MRSRLVYSLRTRATRWSLSRLPLLNRLHTRVTVRDLFSTPGDTLLTGIVCRHLKERYPNLRVNCITKHPDVLLNDPHISELNSPPGIVVIDFWYLDLVQKPDKNINILQPTISILGLGKLDYSAHVYLSEPERTAARTHLAHLPRPLIAFNTLSAQPVKNWPEKYWRTLLSRLAKNGSLIQLGDDREPELPVSLRLAGKLSKRESMAVLGECQLHLGPDSFLMHAANGLNIPSVIIFGGSRTPANLGYATNRNLYADIACSGCWLSGHKGSECPHNLVCMDAISPEMVLTSASELLAPSSASN